MAWRCLSIDARRLVARRLMDLSGKPGIPGQGVLRVRKRYLVRSSCCPFMRGAIRGGASPELGILPRGSGAQHDRCEGEAALHRVAAVFVFAPWTNRPAARGLWSCQRAALVGYRIADGSK